MRCSFDSLIVMFRESGLIDDSQWKRYVGSFTSSGKQFADVVQQEISLATVKDLLFSEIHLPFSKPKGSGVSAALSSQTRLTQGEMLAILQAFKPDVRHVTAPLTQAGLMRQQDVDAALKQTDLAKVEPFERLIRQKVLSPEILTQFLGQSERRRYWPYRQELTLAILKNNKLANGKDVETLRGAGDHPRPLGELLSGEKFQGKALMNAAKGGLELPMAAIKDCPVDEDLPKLFPAGFLRRRKFLPLSRENGVLKVAFADPMNLTLGDILWLLTGLRIEPLCALEGDLAARIESIAGSQDETPETAVERQEERLEDSGANTSTVQLVSSIIEGAIDLGATDVHLEPMANGQIRVRYRIDGRLQNILSLPSAAALPVVSRIKVLANLNVTERRRPQDGHFDLDTGGSRFDFRISSLPCHLGEKVVIRILDERRVSSGLSDLGLEPDQCALLDRLCRQPYGMTLVTGPTGSGKTSTLYACLAAVNSLETNIVTIEDPVEYQLAGVNQVQVNPDIDMGFAEGLRAILRQDPDVIMVGEIRDPETAGIAIRAALTGHLVFSTLHTNTAVGAYSTLGHMGIQPYMTSGAVLAVVAQRLVRKICEKCRKQVAPAAELAATLWGEGKSPEKVHVGAGCDNCIGSGFKGRTCLFEIVETTPELRKLIAKGSAESALARQAVKDGCVTIADAAKQKIEAGVTSLEEACHQVLAFAGM
jgi:type IV pilus assembly protein PilB